MRTLFTGVSVAVCFIVSNPVLAQRISAEPTYRTINISGGFEPDPVALSIVAGGDTDISHMEGCSGFVHEAPDVRVNFSEPVTQLIFSADSNDDVTLLINAPNGTWYCDDDSGEDVNPSIVFQKPQSGSYEVWVGTYGSTMQSATLYISELGSR